MLFTFKTESAYIEKFLIQNEEARRSANSQYKSNPIVMKNLMVN